MKIMDKLKIRIKLDKKIFLFLLILTIIGITAGAVFVSILNSSDQTLVVDHLNNFLSSIKNNKLDCFLALKNNLFSNISYILIIWLLGISVIGLPIIIFMFFSKTFILGFSIGAIISSFKAKGILFSIIYTFPGQVLSLLFILFLVMYAMSFSFKMIYVIFKKKTLDFKLIMNKYFKILIIVLIIVVLMGVYDAYLMPKLVKAIINFIK